MSTHQMHQVEELCDRILLIDQGRMLLHGETDSVRKQFSGNAIYLRTANTLPPLDGVDKVEEHNSAHRLTLSPHSEPKDILHQLVNAGVQVDWFEIAVPSLDEIFIQVVEEPGKDE
jgi:ABC-2 type transport system ATP-binding protein